MELAKLPQYVELIRNLPYRTLISLACNYPCYMYKRILGVRYAEKKVNNYRMLLDLQDQGVSKELMLYQTREQEHRLILQQELSEGMVGLDIGANIGYYSIMMGRLVGRSGKVYAMEPSPSNFHLLNLNIKLNDLDDVVELYNVGISNRTGTENFYQSAKSNWHTFYPKVHHGQMHESLVGETPIRVPVTTIGEFSRNRRKIELIRMDIEGYEVEVFESMQPLLADKDFAPRILFEVHQPRYDENEHSMRKCLWQIFDAGYYVKVLASNQHNSGGAGVFTSKGYTPEQVIKTDGMQRGIFYNISNADTLELICDTDFVRTVLLARK